MLNAAAIKLLVEAIVVSLFPVSLVATIIEGQQWLFQYEFINRLPAGGGSLRSTVLGCYPLTVPKTPFFFQLLIVLFDLVQIVQRIPGWHLFLRH